MGCYFKTEEGLTLVELLAAMVILVGALVGFSYFLAQGYRETVDLSLDRRAVQVMEQRMEEMTGEGFDNLLIDSGVSSMPIAGDVVGINTWAVTWESSCVYSCKLITLDLEYYPPRRSTLKHVLLAKIIAK